MEPPKAGIYTRLSRDRDGTQTATARQEADCRELAAREGWEVAAVYEDSDLSGSKRGVIRPDYERMLDDIRSGRINRIVVWKLDRLSRQPGQFEAIIDVCERVGAHVHSVHETADMTSPAGLAMMRVGMAFAAMETDTMSLRIRRQKAEAADAGLPNGGGLRAFGHTANKREVVEFEADLVRDAAARIIAGESLSSIVRLWASEGVLTTRGNTWTVTTLRKMFSSPRLYGARVHQGRAIDSDVIPEIIERSTWEAVRAVLDAQRLGRGSFVRRPSRALSGIATCARCGMRMRVNYRTTRQVLYRCEANPGTDGCGRMVIAAEPAEAIVGEALISALDGRPLGDALRRVLVPASRPPTWCDCMRSGSRWFTIITSAASCHAASSSPPPPDWMPRSGMPLPPSTTCGPVVSSPIWRPGSPSPRRGLGGTTIGGVPCSARTSTGC